MYAQEVINSVVAAQMAGMPSGNEDVFVTTTIFKLAAASLGLKEAEERAAKIARKLQVKPWEEVNRTMQPSQKVNAGLSEEEKRELLKKVGDIADELSLLD